MILVKEFLGYEDLQERAVNNWLKEKGMQLKLLI